MQSKHLIRRVLAGVLSCLLLHGPATSVAANPNAYEAASSGYFRDQDTLPGAYIQYRGSSEGGGAWWGIGPGSGSVKRSSFSADAHLGVAGYGIRSCVSCHQAQRYSLHSSRGNVTCIQCHRGQPIAGIHHYYSALNPIRKHAYVCAKCHEGASPSFATYVIHEPSPLSLATAQEFSLFYYAVWLMVILAGGVFAIFIPYVSLWALRELIGLLSGRKYSHD
ncbi:MAG: hypothetical protein KZQ95_08385 [Candidatus Thiodiazotropha sp. (ex Epidulcina cf. delphinae)]|nr:hypothetical protein [Candidatus Thiodiazotropha sp. (ex Epidulcina cf. delphinae)]